MEQEHLDGYLPDIKALVNIILDAISSHPVNPASD